MTKLDKDTLLDRDAALLETAGAAGLGYAAIYHLGSHRGIFALGVMMEDIEHTCNAEVFPYKADPTTHEWYRVEK